MEEELDVSNENETYEQLFSALTETITALVREQLSNFRGYMFFNTINNIIVNNKEYVNNNVSKCQPHWRGSEKALLLYCCQMPNNSIS